MGSKKMLPKMLAVAENTRLFQGLNDEQRQMLLGICETRSFAPSDTIFRQGDHDSTMHLILSGDVELMGGDAHIAIISAGQCIGESSLLHDPSKASSHSLDAVAKTPVETTAFSAQALGELICRRPDIGVVLYRNLAIDISAKLRHTSDL